MAAKSLERPVWVRESGPDSRICLDLRRFLRHGLEPLPEVEGLLRELRPCQVLKVVLAGDPEPLCRILGEKGYENYRERKRGVWELFFRNGAWRSAEEDAGRTL